MKTLFNRWMGLLRPSRPPPLTHDLSQPPPSSKPRGARPDAENSTTLYLAKNVSTLEATYQIRLLAYRAVTEKKRLVIGIPKRCRIQPRLLALRDQIPDTLVFERR